MSAEATLWAYRRAPVNNSCAKLILILLAEHANDSGFGRLPDDAAIADFVCCALCEVPEWLDELERNGLLALDRSRDRTYTSFTLNLDVQAVKA